MKNEKAAAGPGDLTRRRDDEPNHEDHEDHEVSK
jgi:hypothetical protein